MTGSARRLGMLSHGNFCRSWKKAFQSHCHQPHKRKCLKGPGEDLVRITLWTLLGALALYLV